MKSFTHRFATGPDTLHKIFTVLTTTLVASTPAPPCPPPPPGNCRQVTAPLHGGRGMYNTADQTLISPCCAEFTCLASHLLAVGCQQLLDARGHA